MFSEFRCLSLSPIDFGFPGVAAATARAGGVGLVDLEFSRSPANLEVIHQFLSRATGDIGVRIDGDRLDLWQDVLLALSTVNHWVVLTARGNLPVRDRIAALPPAESREILVEVTEAAEVADLQLLAISGIVARGSEAGGWTSEDSALILLRKLLSTTCLPIYVLGGIGIRSAAACRAAGARGVVLAEQLLLMPESSVSASMREELSRLDGRETRVFGEAFGQPCRVLLRPGFAGPEAFAELAARVERDPQPNATKWREDADAIIGWETLERSAWPLGQAVGFAKYFRTQYRTTGRLVQSLLCDSHRLMQTAQQHCPLGPGSTLAASHGTRYPIVQGPMTRVSDCPQFAEAVAAAGGLPFLALALMTGEQALDLLQRTASVLREKSWGVGLLGFVPKALRDEQIDAIWKVKPPFALIAGGRPDQAADFEKHGIRTYVHVPTPELLRLFIDQGARRFVFEGRECGGHVGPLSSFVLWENQIQMLLDVVPRADQEHVHILFAGGISDAVSAAMVSVMAAPLAERGMKVGVLMGTAYLFTSESVNTGAIVPEFQQQALRCTRTVNLETGPGHSTRCADTAFAHEFQSERARLQNAGESPDEIRQRLEELNLGRLRVASKGIRRDSELGLVHVDNATQVQEGMYMIGQLATLHDRITTIQELHENVSCGSVEQLEKKQSAEKDVQQRRRPSDIAIIGIATLLPKAHTPAEYWSNILNRISGITEIPKERWDWRLYYDPDKRARDKAYSKWGGFLDEIPFDPIRYGIPPTSLKSIDPLQLLALEGVRRALEDAGYTDGDFDVENTSVILGAGGGLGDLGMQYGVRSEIRRFIEAPDENVWDRLPEWTEESFAGSLLNVVAGRAANRFDFGGLNFTVDAACASALAAVNIAVNELESGRSNVAITGGVDTIQSPFGYLCFSKTQALSPRGKARTFDVSADGIVISEGVVILVLKRLKDAEQDGDRIYAVIKAVAGSSDGKALGLTAPLPAGQKRALQRAYTKAGIAPSSVGLLEAHGTGTAVGDRAEVETIIDTLRGADTPSRSCAIGSVKSLIGHTKAAAGAAGLAKIALALHHRVLPPHEGVEQPLPAIADAGSPVYLLKEPKPWFPCPDQPRRAAVSAFGFGGTNFHALLEEYSDEYRDRIRGLGSDTWPCELFIFRAPDRAALQNELEHLDNALHSGIQPRLMDIAYTVIRRSEERKHGVIASIVATDLADLRDGIRRVLASLQNFDNVPLPPHIQVGVEQLSSKPSLVFLFPGQGSQYPNMAREPALYLDSLRQALEDADLSLRSRMPELLTSYIYPPSAYTEAEADAQARRLMNTAVAQPGIGAVSLGFLDLLAYVGVLPDMVAGHSYGEFVALHAAGVLSRSDLLTISAIRGEAMAAAAKYSGPGAMAAAQASREDVERLVANLTVVRIANHNAPRQVVISGDEPSVRDCVGQLQGVGIDAQMLPVSAAFHSPLMTSAVAPLAAVIETLRLNAPKVPVYSNVTGHRYSPNTDEIRCQLIEHALKPVEFVSQIENMYADGARIFVEVGPKTVLSRLVGQILSNRSHNTVALDCGGLRGLLASLGHLAILNVPVQIAKLYERRDAQQLDFSGLTDIAARKSSSAAWMLSGGCIRVPDDPAWRTGRLPALDLEAVESARQTRVQSSTVTPLSAQIEASSISAHSQWQESKGAVPPGALEAFRAYQDTMREFLFLQERVMANFLDGSGKIAVGGAGSSQTASVATAAAPTPDMAFHVAAPQQVKHDDAQRSNGDLSGGRDALRSQLLNLVSNRTGYPVEMLGLDKDLESELGIDSIKRVEILGALQKELPGIGAEIDMEALTRIKTLNGVLDCLNFTTNRTVSRLDREAAKTGSPVTNDAELQRQIVQIVSERTGYPPEMLRMNQDIEAELGIDSIKRVEILGALTNSFPAEYRPSLESQMEELIKTKTLHALVDRLTATVGGASHRSATEEAGCVESAVVEQDREPEHAIPRFVMEAFPFPAQKTLATALTGLFLVTEDELGVTPVLAAKLRACGAIVQVIPSATLTDADSLATQLRQAVNGDLRLSGVLHLAPLTRDRLPDRLVNWRALCERHVKSLYRILNGCSKSLKRTAQDGVSHLITVSAMDGAFGRRSGDGIPAWTGGNVGLIKTAAAEYPGLNAKALDFAPDATSAEIAGCILDELQTIDGRNEVGFPSGVRTAFLTRSCSHSKAAQANIEGSANWVVLVTGGARGITFELASELVVPGMRFVVVGRSALDSEEAGETAGITELAQLRAVCVARLRAQDPYVSPAAVEKRVHRLLAQREIRRNLSRLADLGAQVEYQSVDVRDEGRFGQIIADIYHKYGRLDAVLHGAGVIEDKLLADKTPQSFDRVFDTKADSAFILSQHLRGNTLRLLIMLTSVAGRYGNRGQGDYAAGNEVLNRLAWHLKHEWPECRVVAFNWGPWDSAGMATETVRRQLRSRGIVPVTVNSGRRFFHNELLFGSLSDVEIIAGDGPWRNEAQNVAPIVHSVAPAASLAFIVGGQSAHRNGTAEMEHTFDLARDPYLHDHRLENVPVLPAAAAAEWMAEFVQDAWRDWVVQEIRDLRVLKWFNLENDEPRRAVFRARPSTHADASSLEVSAEIADTSGLHFYACTILLGPTVLSPVQAGIQQLRSGTALERKSIYQEYLFHGPRLRHISRIHAVDVAGADASVTPSRPWLWLASGTGAARGRQPDEWLFDPGLLDAASQLAVVWSRFQHGGTALPYRFGSVVRFGSEPPPESLTLALRVHGQSSSHSISYDAFFLDANGRLRLQMKQVESNGAQACQRSVAEV